MPTRETKRLRLAELLRQRRPAAIDPALRDELARELAPVSASYLRELLREAGVPLHPLVEGVRQDSFPELERTLNAIGAVYEEARAAGDRAGMMACRKVVIEAKDHARLAMHRAAADTEAAGRKREMIEWMLVWLENPGVFETWARLRSGNL